MVKGKKNAESKATKDTKKEEIVNHQCVVLRAHEFDDCISLTLKINQVTIYNAKYKIIQKKDGSGEFAVIDFPQYKGKDGKYYNYVYVQLTKDDMESIEEQIEEQIGE